MAAERVPSNTQVDNAGEILRARYTDPSSSSVLQVDDPVLEAAALLIFEFRPTVRAPLNKVAQGLCQFARSVTGEERLRVGQRLKREAMIVDKLARFPRMRLSQMQDVGGCRAVLPDRASVAGVLARIEKNWELRGEPRNYSVKPTRQGYRAVHIIVMRDSRLIEVQLRTPGEHSWAVAVERFSHQLRQDLKSGAGPPAMLQYLRLLSELMELRERSAPVDEELVGEVKRLSVQVEELLKRAP